MRSPLLLLFFVAMAFALPAQTLLKFFKLTLEDRLSKVFVSAIFQNRRGFLRFTAKGPYFFACLIWLTTMVSGLAQPNQALEFIKLRHEPSELTRLEVTDILQDRFGFMWFATTKGLIRYDGHLLKTYRENPLEPYGIGSNFLKKLVEDEFGNLWIGSGISASSVGSGSTWIKLIL